MPRRRDRAPRRAAEPDEPEVRGHAYYAAEARRALGITPVWASAAHLDSIAPPAFQAVVAALGSGISLALRPQALGWLPSVGLDALLAALCCLAITVQARLVVGRGPRPGPEVAVVPAVALLSLDVTIAGAGVSLATVLAMAACTAVVALVPHLDALRLLGSDTLRVRLGLDAAATVAALPIALCGAAPAVPAPVRAAVVGCGLGALALDFLRLERSADGDDAGGPGGLGVHAVRYAAAVGAGTGLAALAAPGADSQAAGAAALLLLGYGLRGVGAAVMQRRALLRILEYGVFVAVAAALFAGGHLPGT